MLFIIHFGGLAFQMYRSLFSQMSHHSCHQDHTDIHEREQLDLTEMHSVLLETERATKKVSGTP